MLAGWRGFRYWQSRSVSMKSPAEPRHERGFGLFGSLVGGLRLGYSQSRRVCACSLRSSCLSGGARKARSPKRQVRDQELGQSLGERLPLFVDAANLLLGELVSVPFHHQGDKPGG